MVHAPLNPAAVEAVMIGASAGAVDALRQLLVPLPAALRVPVVVLVHLPPRRPSALVEIFSACCAATVREPDDKQRVASGIWFAPPDYHLLVEADRHFGLSVDQPVHHSRPSIDVLFESGAWAYGESLVAVVLTGASEDGAAGARAVRDAGGFLIVQDPAGAEVSIMPEAALSRAHPQLIAPLPEIADLLCAIAAAR